MPKIPFPPDFTTLQGCAFIFLLLAFTLFLYVTYMHYLDGRKDPIYLNRFDNGQPFRKERLLDFEERRQKNNPNKEPVGKGFGRCGYCGSTKVRKYDNYQHCESCNLAE